MHLYGGSGKHSKKKPEKDKRREEYGYEYENEYENEYEYEDEYEDYEPKPRPRHQTSKSRGRDIKSTNHTVYSGNGYDYEDDVHFASDDYVSREEMRSRKHRGRGALVALGVLLILVIGGFAAFKIWAQPAAVSDGGLNTYDDANNGDGSGGIEGVAPDQADSKRRDGVWTFLVSGLDREGLHTDTNIVGMFDTAAGELNLVNLPRDLLINIDYTYKKMNIPYPASINSGGDGVSALLDAVKDILGYEVDCYAIIDIQAAADIVDAIGGVYYDIPFDMDWDAPDQNPPVSIHIKAGYQRLDGENFVNAMRFRMSNDGSQTYARGDIERIEFQQKLLMALASQTLSLGNITNLPKIYDIVMSSVDTTLSLGNIAYLAAEFLKLSSEDISFMTLPSKPDGTVYGESYVIPYIDDWLVMVNEYFNPFTVEITRDNVDMIATFDNGATFDTTQGYVAGGETHFYGYYY